MIDEPTFKGINTNGKLNDDVPIEHEFYETFEEFYKSYKERNQNMGKTVIPVVILDAVFLLVITKRIPFHNVVVGCAVYQKSIL